MKDDNLLNIFIDFRRMSLGHKMILGHFLRNSPPGLFLKKTPYQFKKWQIKGKEYNLSLVFTHEILFTRLNSSCFRYEIFNMENEISKGSFGIVVKSEYTFSANQKGQEN